MEQQSQEIVASGSMAEVPNDPGSVEMEITDHSVQPSRRPFQDF